jgi:hypothetical protein
MTFIDLVDKREPVPTFFKRQRFNTTEDETIHFKPGSDLVLLNTFTKPITDLTIPCNEYFKVVDTVGVFS